MVCRKQHFDSPMTPPAARRDSKHPKPPPGTKWKEVRHDNKVTWLVSWTENIQGSIKYIMLNPSSRIKVQTDRRTMSCSTLDMTTQDRVIKQLATRGRGLQ